ncbi:MAG: fibrobacter succinogenes major paralogous domain-containing protein, partial [Bacteroidales bacterium]|nr:fibrobacter succinogenes major paralogous domain-containing protein [Bacteroidales bacterium]
KAFATNMAGTASGEIQSFTTTSQLSQPEVITLSATSVGPTTANIRGLIISGGQNMTLGFLYGTYSYNMQHNVIASSTSNDEFSYQIINLTPNTTYYYKAYATNSAGTDEGELLSFTTTPTSSEYDIEIIFSGLGNNNFNTYVNFPVPLDSIKIENLTRNWTRTLHSPDTTLYINLSSSKLIINNDISSTDRIKCTGYTTYRETTYTSEIQTITPSTNSNVSLLFHIPFCDDKIVVIQLQDCEPITYNGVTYDHSDIYTIGQYQTTQGCDSTVILDVRIREHLFSEIIVNTCEESYEYCGHTYTESGIYQHSFASIHGCDSAVSLRLTLGNGFRDERDGNVYCTITLGDQVWMKENLRYLPQQVFPPSDESASLLRYYVYDYYGTNPEEARASENYEKYGVLYNWNAARTACPSGWHLPSDTEWTQLEIYLENNGYNFDGYVDSDNDRDTHNVIAKAMAADNGWTRSDVSNAVGWLQEKNNDSGFTGKPGGQKDTYGIFLHINETALWWTSTPHTDSNSWDRYLYFTRSYCNRTYGHNSLGAYVRCIQD